MLTKVTRFGLERGNLDGIIRFPAVDSLAATMNDAHPLIYSLKRHGTNVRDCEAEPVRTPGCIQPHGVLLVLRIADLTLLQVSENCEEFLALPPAALLGQPVARAIGEDNERRVRDALLQYALERNPNYVFTMPARAGGVGGEGLDASLHTVDGFAILELEPTEREAPGAVSDYYTLVKRAASRFQTAASLQDFCDAAAAEVRAATGLDRVMVYRFHPDASGEVYAEDRRADLPSWLGLRYPASDIPASVREMYKRLTIRPLPDATCEVVELVPLANPDTGAAPELTHCALRGASVMYTEYLANMQVAASLTMPILRDGELWGLIACHHSTPVRMPYRMRAAAEFLAHLVSLQLRIAEDREHHEYARRMDAVHHALVARASTEGGLAVMVDPGPLLSDGIDCTGAAVFHRERWFTAGAVPARAQLEGLARWLQDRLAQLVDNSFCYATDNLGREYPEAAAFAAVASGLLAVPISRSGRNLIVWFRGEVAITVNWAGNPHDKPVVPGPHGDRLTPRRSFELWKESVRGRAKPWLSVEREAARKLRMMVMELVVVRAERVAELNTDLARSNEELDAFAHVASHDLKEPLRGIYKYAVSLLEDARAGRALDAQAQARLDSLLRLTVRMDELLNSLLRYSRVGSTELEYEEVDMAEVAREAIEMVGARASEPGSSVTIGTPMPVTRCDRVKVREILANLVDNALKYNEGPQRIVEIGCENPTAAGREVRFCVRDNGIGIDPRHHGAVFGMFKRLHGRDAFGGGSGAGLAIAKKLVEQHGGAIEIESSPGAGSIFRFTLAPDHAGDE